jgi:hypothetical protein
MLKKNLKTQVHKNTRGQYKSKKANGKNQKFFLTFLLLTFYFLLSYDIISK